MVIVNKQCTLCKEFKPIECFYKNKKTKSGYCCCCKICSSLHYTKPYYHRHKKQVNKAYNKWAKTYPEKIKTYNRKHHYKYYYGITVEDYDRMFEEQNGLCAICGKSETLKYKSVTRHLSVDHDHKSKKVRGLLCDSCNRALGWYECRTDTVNNYLTDVK